MKKCSMCGEYIKLENWPTYKGKHYSYCRSCKRITQREWLRSKREASK